MHHALFVLMPTDDEIEHDIDCAGLVLLLLMRAMADELGPEVTLRAARELKYQAWRPKGEWRAMSPRDRAKVHAMADLLEGYASGRIDWDRLVRDAMEFSKVYG